MAFQDITLYTRVASLLLSSDHLQPKVDSLQEEGASQSKEAGDAGNDERCLVNRAREGDAGGVLAAAGRGGGGRRAGAGSGVAGASGAITAAGVLRAVSGETGALSGAV